MSDSKPKDFAIPSKIGLSGLQTVVDGLTELESDQELLSKFIQCRDRIAIEQLVVRHAPMVSAVCRATANCRSDAEDAFQATFLILVQSAHKIRHQSSLAAWLHGVAYRVASRTRSRRKRDAILVDSVHCDQLDQTAHAGYEDPLVLMARKVELEWLFRELEQLPQKLKSPLIEYYLHGYSAREISERMEISISAVEGRLRRGRRLLRSRLIRHGLSLSVAIGSLSLVKQQLFATEFSQWSSKFILNHIADTESCLHGGSLAGANPELQALVQGEMSVLMKTLLLKSAVGLFAFGSIGTLVAWGVFADDGNPQAGKPSAGMLILRERAEQPPIPQAIHFPQAALGQIGGAPARVQPSEPSLAGEVDKKSPEPSRWQRPEGELPGWLQSDVSTLDIAARIENNRQKLRLETQGIQFKDTPLSQVISEVAEKFQVAMSIDTQQLDNVGSDADTPITISLPACSLHETLSLILRPLDLDYRIRESGIQITSEASTETHGALRGYDLSYLCSTSEHAESIKNSIQYSIVPVNWVELGGTSTMTFVGSMLIVVCPDRIHNEIEDFLRLIAKTNLGNPSPPKSR